MIIDISKKNNYPINEATTIDTREKELRILKTIANPVINATKAKFGKLYNVSKYVKVYNTDPDNEDLFIDGSSPFGIIDLISPVEFVEEYNFKTWKEYNEFFGFIMDEVEKKVSEKKLTGSVSADLEKDGGWIFYSSKL